MTDPGGAGGGASASASAGADVGTACDPRVAAAVRLLHRRRGWAWTAAGSFVALVAATTIQINLDPDKPGQGSSPLDLIITLFLALTVVALIAVVVDTVRLRRHHVAVRAIAAGGIGYSFWAQPYRHRPGHAILRVLIWLQMAMFLLFWVGYLPAQVNAVASLAGATRSATFVPRSYGQDCGRYGCSTVTHGTLLTGGAGTSSTWPDKVPLGKPFRVAEPVWTWGIDPKLPGSTSDAIAVLIGGAISDFLLLAVAFVIVARVRSSRPSRRNLVPRSSLPGYQEPTAPSR
ncbi:MAG: hypothetical protein J2P25_24390 [Nocardiopsaceae bacterium]|nr:hypothetical protein [Nocardiopsaceae bacterium]